MWFFKNRQSTLDIEDHRSPSVIGWVYWRSALNLKYFECVKCSHSGWHEICMYVISRHSGNFSSFFFLEWAKFTIRDLHIRSMCGVRIVLGHGIKTEQWKHILKVLKMLLFITDTFSIKHKMQEIKSKLIKLYKMSWMTICLMAYKM